MVIILQRRIMNQLLTTYLPSILILIIVYLTSFFKPFFFEAVVTVNLTALLVLTTLFISVSGTINGYRFHTLCLKFCHKFYNTHFFVTIHILVILTKRCFTIMLPSHKMKKISNTFCHNFFFNLGLSSH